MKKLILVTISCLCLFLISCYFLIGPRLIVVNHTQYPLWLTNLQYLERGNDDFTQAELESVNDFFYIEKESSREEKLYYQNWFVEESIYIGIGLRYYNEYLTEENMYDLTGATFLEKSDYLNQKSHCKFRIDVYPNNKTIVTPLKRFCFKPFYYHSNQ